MSAEARPRWLRVAGYAAVAAALPTVIWRVVVGLGPTLGTPASWREREQLPGSGTGYVVGLSVAQLIAALLVLILVRPQADRWFPKWLVVAAASLGTTVLAIICVLSVIKWHNVDPFADASEITGWTLLCWACYAVALAWPVLLAVTITGYVRVPRRA